MSLSPYVSSVELEGKKIQIETGGLARQADGAVLVSCGDDQVLAAVVSSREEVNFDFLPLTIEYKEKFYSAGKIPGGFFRREGRPSYESILSSRMIDRPNRPCFPEGYNYETQAAVSVLSYSGSCSINALAGLGVSAALHISDIPFDGPVASVQIAKAGGKWLLNPGVEDLKKSELNMMVSGRRSGLLMVEGEARFISEAEALEALRFAHKQIQPLLDMQEDLRKKSGSVPKRKYKVFELNPEWSALLKNYLKDKTADCLKIKDKSKRVRAFAELKESALQKLVSEGDDDSTKALKKKNVNAVLDKEQYTQARSLILSGGQRIDGRSPQDIRPISTQAGLLKRVHGSALFTRGETQVLGTATLGTVDDEQKLDNLEGFGKKQFLLHYNFPPYSVGEVGRMGGQSRREVGHGSLAEKALSILIPPHDTFPYTVRVVGEVLESNGSSSMGTVCAGSMALMDAGVPVKDAAAGIAMGFIQEGDKNCILSDILGDEDHLGDMDFKVAGTKDGITALQMDIKAKSLSFEVLEKALEQARAGRLHILNEMAKTLKAPRGALSAYAPRIEIMHIKPDKIRSVIGAGGKVINKIIEETGVKVDIEDTGRISLAASSEDKIKKAKTMIEGLSTEVEAGSVYEGKVVRLAVFGAFVEILPNTIGLLHISEIAHERIRQVQDVLNEGDTVKVKVLEIGERGKMRLSRKALL